jgi:ketosteroid isomerase-like protein
MRKLLPAFALALCACSHNTIPGTNIRDDPQNRAVLDVLAQYKAAMEARDVNALLSLTAPGYFDKGDAAHPNEARTFDGLQKELPEDFKTVKSVHLDLTLRDLEVQGDRAQIDYYAVLRYALATPNGEKWYSQADDARMRLVKLEGAWKIASGL